MGSFTLHYDGEPRGDPYDEPRPDDLWLDEEHGVWRKKGTNQAVCGALNRSRDWEYGRCKRTDRSRGGRCFNHGGESKSGKDSGTYKHGKYSQDLPDNLRERYEEVTQDDRLTNLREEIALIETRIHEVLDALDAKDSAELWGRIETSFERFKAARASGDQQDMARHLSALGSAIEEGAEQRSKWAEIGDLVDMKRKLVESERRREKDLQAYVPLERFSILLGVIDDIVRSHVEDPETMQQIAREIKRTTSLSG